MEVVDIDVWKDGEVYVAKCRQLPVASQGTSIGEAVGNIEEALRLYLEDADVQAKGGKPKAEEAHVLTALHYRSAGVPPELS